MTRSRLGLLLLCAVAAIAVLRLPGTVPPARQAGRLQAQIAAALNKEKAALAARDERLKQLQPKREEIEKRFALAEGKFKQCTEAKSKLTAETPPAEREACVREYALAAIELECARAELKSVKSLEETAARTAALETKRRQLLEAKLAALRGGRAALATAQNAAGGLSTLGRELQARERSLVRIQTTRAGIPVGIRSRRRELDAAKAALSRLPVPRPVPDKDAAEPLVRRRKALEGIIDVQARLLGVLCASQDLLAEQESLELAYIAQASREVGFCRWASHVARRSALRQAAASKNKELMKDLKRYAEVTKALEARLQKLKTEHKEASDQVRQARDQIGKAEDEQNRVVAEAAYRSALARAEALGLLGTFLRDLQGYANYCFLITGKQLELVGLGAGSDINKLLRAHREALEPSLSLSATEGRLHRRMEAARSTADLLAERAGLDSESVRRQKDILASNMLAIVVSGQHGPQLIEAAIAKSASALEVAQQASEAHKAEVAQITSRVSDAKLAPQLAANLKAVSSSECMKISVRCAHAAMLEQRAWLARLQSRSFESQSAVSLARASNACWMKNEYRTGWFSIQAAMRGLRRLYRRAGVALAMVASAPADYLLTLPWLRIAAFVLILLVGFPLTYFVSWVVKGWTHDWVKDAARASDGKLSFPRRAAMVVMRAITQACPWGFVATVLGLAELWLFYSSRGVGFAACVFAICYGPYVFARRLAAPARDAEAELTGAEGAKTSGTVAGRLLRCIEFLLMAGYVLGGAALALDGYPDVEALRVLFWKLWQCAAVLCVLWVAAHEEALLGLGKGWVEGRGGVLERCRTLALYTVALLLGVTGVAFALGFPALAAILFMSLVRTAAVAVLSLLAWTVFVSLCRKASGGRAAGISHVLHGLAGLLITVLAVAYLLDFWGRILRLFFAPGASIPVPVAKAVAWIAQAGKGLRSMVQFRLGENVTSGRVVLAAAILLGGWSLARWLSRYLKEEVLPLTQINPERGVNITSGVATLLLIVVCVCAAVVSGFSTSHLVWLVAAAFVGLGFGMQAIVRDVVSGLIVHLTHALRIGDVARIDQHTGTVCKIGLRSTTLETLSGETIHVPSRQVVDGVLSNLSRGPGGSLVTVSIPTPRDVDVDEFISLATQEALNHPEVQSDPPPRVGLREIGLDELDFAVAVNVRSPALGEEVAGDLRLSIVRRLRGLGSQPDSNSTD